MSAKGNCWDNAVAESWNGKLKTEWGYPRETYQTIEDAKQSVFGYIEGYYNNHRLHQTLG
jgi:transposase InsO family protein